MMVQAWLWGAAAGAISLAAGAALAEHRRERRRDLDRVGWVPWNAIQVVAAIFAAAAMAVAFHM